MGSELIMSAIVGQKFHPYRVFERKTEQSMLRAKPEVASQTHTLKGQADDA